MADMMGKTVMVLGGFGLVGRAICHELVKLGPEKIIVLSLHEAEARQACRDLEVYKGNLKEDFGLKVDTQFVPEWGDIFARTEHKELDSRVLADPKYLDQVIADTFDDLAKVDIEKAFLFKLLVDYRPHIVIDSVNTATGVAYRNIYNSVIELRKSVQEVESAIDSGPDALADAAKAMVQRAREHLSGIYLPRLIRHVQLLYKGMEKARTGYYIKIGTTGTGGMGLNIPYTHSEEKPSQQLLSKSAVGGAHSLLLYLMSKTPDMAHTMEFKPAAAIAWKKIGYGEVKKAGKPVLLCDNDPANAFELGDSLTLNLEDPNIVCSDEALQAVFIDTGENGLFSAGEFGAITTTGQMEYVTPEEIAGMVIEEVKGGNSGYDIMGSLSNTVMRSTYRAGFMRHAAISKLRELEKKHGDSVAFEILGPPRLSKLLFEAYLLKRIYKTPQAICDADAKTMSKALQSLITEETELRRKIVSIGIPVLLSDGAKLVRGNTIKIPPYRGTNEIPMTPEDIEVWSHDGWVDLRPKNMDRWRRRMATLVKIMNRHDWDDPNTDTSSNYNRKDFLVDGQINIGEVVGWIFNLEEGGARKYYNVTLVDGDDD
jgi:hypothetical protein